MFRGDLYNANVVSDNISHSFSDIVETEFVLKGGCNLLPTTPFPFNGSLT